MNAQVLNKVGDIRLEQVPMPAVQPGWKLVKVEDAGICGSDIPRIYRDGAHKMPLIPGHEFAGREVETGKRVGIFPLIPCGECPQCKSRQYEMCQNYNYLGSRCHGGFAEYVAVPEWNLLELPENVAFEDAAMLEPTAVAAHAMRRALGNLKAIHASAENNENVLNSQTIAVYGLGTIGLLLVMLLKDAGFSNILAIGNKDIQKEKVMELGIGAENFCDTRTEDLPGWLMARTGGSGADIFFECVGNQKTITDAVNQTAKGGITMLVGNPASDILFPKEIYWRILRGQLTVLGTWNSSYTGEDDDDWHYVLQRIAQGGIQPSKLITHRFALTDMEQGLHIMWDKTEEYVKVMIGFAES